MGMNDVWEEAFHRNMAILAHQTEHVVQEEELEMYDRALNHYGYEKLARAVEHIILNRSERDRFPSIATLRAVISPSLPHNHRAKIIADKIWKFIGSRGRNWSHHFKDSQGFQNALNREFGHEGREAILNMGGWKNMCLNSDETDHGVMKAQILRSVEAMVNMRSAGIKSPQEAITGPADNELKQIANVSLKSIGN